MSEVIPRIVAIVIGIVAFVIPEGASSVLGVGLIAWGLGADELMNGEN